MTEGGVLGATTPPLPLELLHPQGSAVGEEGEGGEESLRVRPRAMSLI